MQPLEYMQHWELIASLWWQLVYFPLAWDRIMGTHLACFPSSMLKTPRWALKLVLWWHEWQISSVFFWCMSTACLPTAVTHPFIKFFKCNLACIVCNWVHSLLEATDCLFSFGKLSQTRSNVICVLLQIMIYLLSGLYCSGTRNTGQRKRWWYYKRWRVHFCLKQPVTQKLSSKVKDWEPIWN